MSLYCYSHPCFRALVYEDDYNNINYKKNQSTMSRPTKNIVEYFPHYVNNGKTLFTLEKKFGNDGYAFLFKTLEILGKSENHFFDCRNSAEWEFMLAITNVNGDIAEEIMQLLVKLGTFDKELWDNRIIFSQNFINNLKSVYERRKRKCIHKQDICKQLLGLCIHKPPSAEFELTKSTQSKVEEVKESKVEERRDGKELTQLQKWWNELISKQAHPNPSITIGNNIFPICRKISIDIIINYTEVRKKYDFEDIKYGFEQYAKELVNRKPNEGSTYFEQRWSFFEFIKNEKGLIKFINK